MRLCVSSFGRVAARARGARARRTRCTIGNRAKRERSIFFWLVACVSGAAVRRGWDGGSQTPVVPAATRRTQPFFSPLLATLHGARRRGGGRGGRGAPPPVVKRHRPREHKLDAHVHLVGRHLPHDARRRARQRRPARVGGGAGGGRGGRRRVAIDGGRHAADARGRPVPVGGRKRRAVDRRHWLGRRRAVQGGHHRRRVALRVVPGTCGGAVAVAALAALGVGPARNLPPPPSRPPTDTVGLPRVHPPEDAQQFRRARRHVHHEGVKKHPPRAEAREPPPPLCRPRHGNAPADAVARHVGAAQPHALPIQVAREGHPPPRRFADGHHKRADARARVDEDPPAGHRRHDAAVLALEARIPIHPPHRHGVGAAALGDGCVHVIVAGEELVRKGAEGAPRGGRLVDDRADAGGELGPQHRPNEVPVRQLRRPQVEVHDVANRLKGGGGGDAGGEERPQHRLGGQVRVREGDALDDEG
ncbi:hypothetical protein BU14_2610s0001 [Porphyra umbilicalis]|uniref:Uncharacterized protein n=1 Tax=Porphyra umbilicalis TaxID=2786 RepID=A0A1X6NIU9_PORUM|nr:hypothetical protein BU14_2610s0001 [Porphyra umbilicalis]|eukprot:OSX68539.1 hypothetical protein BU14_2610s0001 [Porphyra umbilicalis]